MVKKKLTVALTLTAAGIAATLGFASPASAAGLDGVINTGEFVSWRDSSFRGALRDETGGNADYDGDRFVNSTGRFNDEVSSSNNYNSTRTVRSYINRNGGGASLVHNPNSGFSSLGSFNDEISSHYFS